MISFTFRPVFSSGVIGFAPLPLLVGGCANGPRVLMPTPNLFDDALFAMAELWHFIERSGVPVVYTWPAGYPGMFGYTYDRESSEFTIHHLRETLRFLSEIPEIEKIHVILPYASSMD